MNDPTNNRIESAIEVALILLCATALFALHGCKAQRIDSSTHQQTIVETERYDTTYTVAGDSATAAMLFRCDSLGNVYLANLNTEQGERLRLELLVTTMQARLDSTDRVHNHKPKNQPMYVQVDCKEDSFSVIIRGLRERIAYLEENSKETQVPVRYVPDYYKNCTRGFWTLLALILITAALLVWKNWGKIRTWWLRLVSRIITK